MPDIGWPTICFDTTEGNQDFVDVVKAAVQNLNFETDFHTGPRRFFELGGRKGWWSALEFLKKEAPKGVTFFDMQCQLGQAIFDRIHSPAPRPDLFPMNDFSVRFVGNLIELRFSSLVPVRSGNAMCFSSRLRPQPQVEFYGRRYRVVFSKHIWDCTTEDNRRIERINTGFWLRYDAASDAHAILANTRYFDPIKLRESSVGPLGPGIGLWDQCVFDMSDLAPIVSLHLCKYWPILKEEIPQVLGQNKPFYRLGYCPLVLLDDSELAIAKTFLRPGFEGTPEREAIEKADIPKNLRSALLASAREDFIGPSILRPDGKMLLWCHKNGVPQATWTPLPIFSANH